MKIFAIIRKYFGESRIELSKVIWPKRAETIRYSAIVILAIVVATGVVALFDVGLIKIVQFFVIR